MHIVTAPILHSLLDPLSVSFNSVPVSLIATAATVTTATTAATTAATAAVTTATTTATAAAAAASTAPVANPSAKPKKRSQRVRQKQKYVNSSDDDDDNDGDKPYVMHKPFNCKLLRTCPFCKRSRSQLEILHKHVQRKCGLMYYHVNTCKKYKDRRFQCGLCAHSVLFTRYKGLREHFGDVHWKQMPAHIKYRKIRA